MLTYAGERERSGGGREGADEDTDFPLLRQRESEGGGDVTLEQVLHHLRTHKAYEKK